ncbi:MAG TPA: restriction endonuclease [Candidatus Paceibacterota bacterium]|nr:restriction endonuclease [Candidatus Paceibacterota bacterium]
MSVLITKADGIAEPFEAEKLVRSLRRAGADEAVAEHIRREIEKELRPAMTTSEIYSRAFAHLSSEKHGPAARYSLKRALLDFGPSGFPFEAFIAEIYRAEGYQQVSIDQIIKGNCVEHEVDVVATKDGETLYVEAKFHNSPAFKADLKVVLYVQARIEDIVAAGHPNAKGLVVTNTKFTDMAKRYAECRLLGLLAWDYPQGATLHERIDRAGLYPVTALTTLSKREKTALLGDKIVLCNTLEKHRDTLERLGVTGTKLETVLEEVRALCSPIRDI